MAEANPGDDFALRRAHMVDSQLRTCDVADQAVLSAFASIPRESFVAPAFASLAYLDREAPALGARERVLLAPMVLAKLIQAANVRSGDTALDVAGGSGYSAAILASLGAKVFALEDDSGAVAAAKTLLASERLVEFVSGDLAAGIAGRSFDVILLNGAFASAPDGLIAQLADNGRFVAVDASSGAAKAVLIEMKAGVASRRILFNANATTLSAFRREVGFAF